ncbi:hypothetical protein [Brevibacillus borstelensis]|uniref:hypothetical protein n=1 Tax=Brevibacillus borstelensis TaxID=45462 RepID=UPI0030BA3545
MIVLFEKETETKARVTLIHYMPDDPKEGLPEEVKRHGIRVNEIPEKPEAVRAKSAVLYVNPETADLWYEMVDRPLTQEEILQQQNEKIDLLLMNQLESEGIL